MYSKDQIKENLKKDSSWELPDDASLEEWESYDEAWEELEESGEVNLSVGSDDDLDDDWEDE